MENLKNFSPEESKYLNLLKTNEMGSTSGSLKMCAMPLVLVLGMCIGMLAFEFKFSVPYGMVLFEIALAAGAFVSFRQFFIVVDYKNKFVKLFAERTGLKIINKDSMFSEHQSPQLYDEKNKIYYKVQIHKTDIIIREIKDV